jgi:hypothetical protein
VSEHTIQPTSLDHTRQCTAQGCAGPLRD